MRYLVELHGGTVEAKNGADGRGAMFAVKLPLMPTRSPDAAFEHPKDADAAPDTVGFEPPPLLDGVHVLLVDDEEDTQLLVGSMLEKSKARVTKLSSAADAITALEQLRPDVLVADIGMPEEDGYSLISRVRNLPVDRGGLTPAAALTGYARPEDRQKALISGFQMHVAKPVDASELVTVVASLAGRVRGGSLVDPSGKIRMRSRETQ